MPKAIGAAWNRKRGDAELFEEKVVDRLAEQLDKDLDGVFGIIAPSGRPPYTVQLSQAETAEQFDTATPEQHQAWLDQLSALPEGEPRYKALADYFKLWAGSQLRQQG